MPPLTAPLPADQPLTDRLLRSWLRCRRRAWLDRFGVAGERRWNAHRALALSDQLRSFQTLLANRPGHGEAACAAGAPGVVGLRLRGHDPQGRRLEAHPALLERIAGTSRWGDFAYRPVLARQGYRRIETKDGALEVIQDRVPLAAGRRARIVEALERSGFVGTRHLLELGVFSCYRGSAPFAAPAPRR